MSAAAAPPLDQLAFTAFTVAKKCANAVIRQRIFGDDGVGMPTNGYCTECGGTGAPTDARYMSCQVCGGTGVFDQRRELLALTLREANCKCATTDTKRDTRWATDGMKYFGRDVAVCSRCHLVTATRKGIAK